MKKIATLILAAGLVFGAATGSSAVEFDAKGQWLMNFEYGQGGALQNENVYGWGNGADSFEAKQRVRLQLDVVASEALSGSVMFEMGNTTWGSARANQGGALGTDANSVEVKHAYLDWIVPNTALKIRMGLQNIALPSYSFNSSQVFNNDSAAIAASYQFNDNMGATLVWTRPYNDNYTNNTINGDLTNAYDNLDIFAIILPMSFNNVKVTPWAAYAMIGRNFVGDQAVGYINNVVDGMIATTPQGGTLNTYSSAYWVGLTGEVTTGGPLRFAWDANYGAVDYGVSSFNREGYYLDALVEYKMAWGTPGLYAWYGSGDDGDLTNGSERMPSVSADGNDQRSNFAGTGGTHLGREGLIADQWTGTWGVGVRLKDMSFVEDLTHTLRVNYMTGTNDPTNVRGTWWRDGLARTAGNSPGGATMGGLASWTTPNGTYLTTVDQAVEVGLSTTYKIYDNLTMQTELAYIFMFLDEDLWGKGNSYTDPWNINVTFAYDF